MKLIVGLGNVGHEYKTTRHNVGFMFVDAISDLFSLGFDKDGKHHSDVARGSDIFLVKPTTMMNSSGKAVSSIANFYKISPKDIYVVFDDLDIALGEYKIQKGKGPKDHNGLNSIYKKLGSKDFWHIRLGVENRGEGIKVPGEDYVLMPFTEDERMVIDSTIKKAIEDVRSQLVD